MKLFPLDGDFVAIFALIGIRVVESLGLEVRQTF